MLLAPAQAIHLGYTGAGDATLAALTYAHRAAAWTQEYGISWPVTSDQLLARPVLVGGRNRSGQGLARQQSAVQTLAAALKGPLSTVEGAYLQDINRGHSLGTSIRPQANRCQSSSAAGGRRRSPGSTWSTRS